MIEKILRGKAKIFRYGTVISYDAADEKAQVQIGETTTWIKTATSLNAGDTVLLARNDQDRSYLIVEASGKALPSQTSLLLV